MALFELRDVKGGKVVNVPVANVVTLVSLLPAKLQKLAGVLRGTLHNISANNIEIGYLDENGAPPLTGEMDVLVPGDTITFAWQGARLKKLYVKAAGADSKAYLWLEGK